MITYPNAAVAYTNGYQPYGQYTGTLTGNLGKWAIDKFDGKPFSVATGLYYYYHRWYDPSVGRFISQDPIAGDSSDPQTLNAYIYALDAPTTGIDPSGLGVYVSARADPCRASKDFWSHFECSFTNPQAIILGLEFSPEGAAVGLGIWGVEESAPYLPLIISGGLTAGAVGLTIGYDFVTGRLKLPDITSSNGGDGGLRTGITRTGTGPTVIGPGTGTIPGITGGIGGEGPTITGHPTGLAGGFGGLGGSN